MINVGFIGLGGMGSHQITSFGKVRGCRIVAGADLADAGRERFAKNHPKAAVYTNYRDLLKDSNVDAVVVAVPTGYHAKVAMDVMRSGRPVLCEKPMARTVSAARKMIDTSNKTRQLLMIAHCRRYDEDWGGFAKIVNAGTLGRPLLWRHVMGGRGPGGWFMDDKLGGGPLIDGAVHNYDFANYIFGDPDEVMASSIKLSGHSAVDTASAVVRYKKGDQLMVSWSWHAPGGGCHDALGPRASVMFGAGPLADKVKNDGQINYCIMDHKRGPTLKQFRRGNVDMYVKQGRHFLECIGSKAKCKSSGPESIKAVAVAEALLKAAPTGGKRKVVW